VDLLAFFLALAAILLFLVDFFDRQRSVSRFPNLLPLALALFVGAMICQFTHPTSSLV
jgi:hypothetical protein